jgi:hypothetical protein
MILSNTPNRGILLETGGSTSDQAAGNEIEYFTEYNPAVRSVYGSLAEANSDPRNARVKLRTASGSPRCAGSAMDNCIYDWRGNMTKKFTEEKVIGDHAGTDSWNMRDHMIKSGAGKLYWSADSGIPLTEELIKAIPLNSLIGSRDARGMYGVSGSNPHKLSRHYKSVVGWDEETGTPLLRDWSHGIVEGTLEQINDAAYGIPRVNEIIAPAQAQLPTFAEAKAAKELNRKQYGQNPLQINISDYITTLKESGTPIAENFPAKLEEFNSSILKNRDAIMQATRLSEIGFNELHKQALALATQESGNASASLTVLDNLFGDSTGLTQIKSSNRESLDEIYPDATRVFNIPTSALDNNKMKDPDVNAFYTMLLLANNARRYDEMRDITEGSGKITEINNVAGERINKLLDQDGVAWYRRSPTMDILRKVFDSDDVIKLSKKVIAKFPETFDNKDFRTTRATEGNADNLTDPEIAAYMWNNPARILTGDAQGAKSNSYVNNVLSYYNIIK